MLCRTFKSTRLAVKGTESVSSSRLCLKEPRRRNRARVFKTFLPVKALRQKTEEAISPAIRPVTAIATPKRIPWLIPYR